MDTISPTHAIESAHPSVQDGANAFVKSQQIWIEGMQSLSKTVAEMAQAQMSRSLSDWTALSGVKSLPEAFEVQKLHASKSIGEMFACTGRLTSASVSLCQRTMEPITAQMTHTVQKYSPLALMGAPAASPPS